MRKEPGSRVPRRSVRLTTHATFETVSKPPAAAEHLDPARSILAPPLTPEHSLESLRGMQRRAIRKAR
jgi:hypothetical protein